MDSSTWYLDMSIAKDRDIRQKSPLNDRFVTLRLSWIYVSVHKLANHVHKSANHVDRPDNLIMR